MNKSIKILLASLLFGASIARAGDVLSVSDFEMLKIAGAQLDKIEKQLSALDEQKKVLEASKAAMEGHYNYSSAFDKPALTTWQHSGKDWSSLMTSHEGGGSDPLTALAKQMEKEFPVKSSGSVFSQNSEQAKLYDLLAKTTVASRASNTLAYNSIETELAMLEELQREIEKSPNQKATLDLIARIQIEGVKLAAYKIKTDAVSAELAGLQSQQEVSDAKWASDFFKWR